MFVSHFDFLGTNLEFNWRKDDKNRWLINSISVGKKKAFANFPDDLQKMIRDVETLFNSWHDGLIENLPIDLLDFEGYKITDNQKKVFLTLYQEVPRGHVITYKDLGIKAGFGPSSSRFIGNAMRINPWPFFIPCHRVVPSTYEIGNYSLEGPSLKEKLLRMEGVKIEKGICHYKCNP